MIKQLYMPSADSPVFQWLVFVGFLLLLCVALGGFFVWLKVGKGQKKRRKRKHKHHHRINPTLAETGGLPPKRDANTPPPGP